MPLKTRKPTGAVPYPFVLVEGEEKAGKSWAAATLTGSPRIGRAFWLDLGEGSQDEYALVPGADYEVIDTDGTWHDLVEQITAVRDVAAEAKEAGDLPVLLVVDSMTALWDGLKVWVAERAKGTDGNRRLLAKNPDAELNISMNFWNDANARHRRIMGLLLSFPGIVVGCARGKETVTLDDNGRPIPGAPATYKVEGQKNLAYESTLWVRMTREKPPAVVAARSTFAGKRPDTPPEPVAKGEHNDRLLDWLIFDVLKVDPETAHVRDVQDVRGGEATPEERGQQRAQQRQERQRPPEPEVPAALVRARNEAVTWAESQGWNFDGLAEVVQRDMEKPIRDLTADELNSWLKVKVAEQEDA